MRRLLAQRRAWRVLGRQRGVLHLIEMAAAAGVTVWTVAGSEETAAAMNWLLDAVISVEDGTLPAPRPPR